MNREIRIAILKSGFDLQCDFANAVGMSAPVVCNILKNRKTLTEAQSKVWQKVLKCKPKLLKAITD